MSRILVDTSAYSALLRSHPEILEAFGRADEVHLNAVVLGELRAGFRAGTRRRENERTLLEFLEEGRTKVLPLDEDTADCYAEIFSSLRAAGTPIPTNDLWIAASAMQYGLRLLTTDRHYLRVHQVIVDYCEP
ncbi:MAG: type II toxin-antitoxin system VapC family toxin [Bdellovibrionota bacterium]